MNASAPDFDPEAHPYDAKSTYQPEMYRRMFECGHPEEFIEARLGDDGDQVHNLVTIEVFEAISRRFGSLPAYIQARCLTCAKVAKEQDDRDPKVRPKRTLGTYQAVHPSALATKPVGPSLIGLGDLLNRHHHCNYQVKTVQPHERVSEDKHRAHRLDMQVQAVKCAGKWLAVPVRRVWNMPVQTEAPVRPAGGPKDTRHLDKIEETHRSTKPEDYTGEGTVDSREGIVEISRADISKDEDESFRKAAVNTISSSRSKSGRREDSLKTIKPPSLWDSEPMNSVRILLDQAAEVHHHENALDIDSAGRHSTFSNDLVYHYESSLDALSDLSLTHRSFEPPRPAPSIPPTPISPKKRALDFIMRRSSFSTKRLTKSEPASMNFRKLGIDIHSARSIKKTDLDSDSPDWACQTSLAIEAGMISMDSVSKPRRDSMVPKHGTETMRSTSWRRNTYPSPSGDRSPTSARYVKHSERVPQALRASAARYSGTLVGMEIASPQKESPRHDSAQIAPARDLNKSLPAPPAQDQDNDGEESVELS